MRTVPDLIAAWRAEAITGAALMRALIAHPAWDVPISEAAVGLALAENRMPPWQLCVDGDGRRCLTVFSSRDAYLAYLASGTPRQQHFISLPGTAVFGNAGSVDRLMIDPESAHAIWYGPEQIERLSVYRAAMAVEEALSSLRIGTSREGAIDLVRGYAAYSMPVVIVDGRQSLLFAPDAKGRKLAAIFTADDTFETFVPEARQQAPGGDIQQWQVPGPDLFPFLQKLDVEGFVFNCSGPLSPVAFGHAMAQIVVQA